MAAPGPQVQTLQWRALPCLCLVCLSVMHVAHVPAQAQAATSALLMESAGVLQQLQQKCLVLWVGLALPGASSIYEVLLICLLPEFC